jgi:hypothetical protein
MKLNLYRFRSDKVKYDTCTIIAESENQAREVAIRNGFPEPFSLEKLADLDSLQRPIVVSMEVLPF